MGILKRVKTIFTADVHEALDRMENPISMMNEYMRNLEEQVGDAQKAFATNYILKKDMKF
ncbi:PspA/IM30 family protein [Neobacillus sp. PS3-34]|uniref:PspA/IM30 family protein n=1 Tax=Neobacillus sp. PS3-34 TaxID=3070678 RepID=UPI0027E00B75|nr:PspA/IM30 family protein [Neobacillus sp. PS3-34]WML49778.1 PspA/IM30 family protein [Neobacillus sp. PS3-34]